MYTIRKKSVTNIKIIFSLGININLTFSFISKLVQQLVNTNRERRGEKTFHDDLISYK